MTEAETKSIAVCNGERAEEVAEAYLLGTLSMFEMERFEEHYFECPACFAHLQALQSVQQELISRPSPVAVSPMRLRRRLLALGAIAAAVAAGFISFHRMRENLAHPSPTAVAQQAAPAMTAPAAANTKENPPVNVASLADLSLPPYIAGSVRSGEVEGPFQAGMRSYTAGNCAKALPQLKSVPAKDENAVAAQLYAGACELSAHETGAAVSDFKQVIVAGDTPQFEAAYYYLAQSMLLEGKTQAARECLAKTIALQGDFEQRARIQLAQLTASN
jgi:anti-sigma factor RsiW